MVDYKSRAAGDKPEIDPVLKKIFGDGIYSYATEQAVEDGVLVKVDDPHINIMTRNVFDTLIEPRIVRDEDGKEMVGKWPTSAELVKDLIGRVKARVMEIQITKGLDSLYSIESDGHKFFVQQNETGKYTLLFPEDL